ncbi:HNH endonuclease [Falsiroseomonas sp. E2-1-a20]|uniref:HNH endonuclease n=1 Tax=Falsiroseomonas sp. E2-1-a20 TaxID=3239300 RepID=UPI003F3C2248
MALTPEMIASALRQIGRAATVPEIRDKLLEMFPSVPMGKTPLQSIRARLQENCPESGQWNERVSLFRRVTPVQARLGVWELRGVNAAADQSNIPPSGDDEFVDDVEINIGQEGRQRLHTHLKRERSIALVRRFKETLSSFSCQVCGFDFFEKYGEIGAEYIEAHHVLPIAAGERATDLTDLVAVCSNCHRMLHRSGLMEWQDLRERLGRA